MASSISDQSSRGRSELACEFVAAVQALRSDPGFAIPAHARGIAEQAAEGVTKVVILGTRGLGSYLLDLSVDARNCDVIAVVDDTLSATQSMFRGIPLLTAAQLLALSLRHRALVAINTCGASHPRAFFDQLCQASGIACVGFEQAIRLFALHGRLDPRVEDWGPDIVRNVDRYQALADRLVDEESVVTLYALLNHYLRCDPAYIHGVQEKMVDCGASVGESLRGLIKATGGDFAHSWMIEPDRHNLKALQALVDGYRGSALAGRISLLPCAVGEAAGHAGFRHEGGHGGAIQAGQALDGEAMIEVCALDEIIDDIPTFIKMDVEGSELSALKGASEIISTCKPKLAISAYHRSTDLLDLTDHVLSLRPDYQVGLRHHTPFRWDTCLYFY